MIAFFLLIGTLDLYYSSKRIVVFIEESQNRLLRWPAVKRERERGLGEFQSLEQHSRSSFEPFGGAPGTVGESLRFETIAFEAKLAGMGEDGWAVALDMLVNRMPGPTLAT